MIEALGTLTPTSTTVVATSTFSRPSANSAITASFSGPGRPPWTRPTPSPSSSRRISARFSAAARSAVSDSEIRGQIQKAWAPLAVAWRSRSTTSPIRGMGAARVATGVRPGGFSVRRETSRSP